MEEHQVTESQQEEAHNFPPFLCSLSQAYDELIEKMEKLRMEIEPIVFDKYFAYPFEWFVAMLFRCLIL